MNAAKDIIKKTPLKHFPLMHTTILAGLVISLGTIAALPGKQEAEEVRIKQTLAIPNLVEREFKIESAIPEVKEPQQTRTHTETVKSGDNLSKLFARAGLNDKDVYHITRSSTEGKNLARLYPGHQFVFELNVDGSLKTLTHIKNALESQTFTRDEDTYIHSLHIKEPELYPARRAGTIESSLYEAAQAARLDDELIMELAGIFGWDIDFALDIRSGDSFKILYEEAFLDGEKIGNGEILAAEFVNQGRLYKAVRYVDSKGNSQYYAPNGDTMRKEFLRTPIDFARISSHFNLRRKHPVLNTIRAHKGTDYAAPRGTPIKAAGDGKVIFAGKKGGYGNTLIIQHGQTYKTLYAHIHKFRKGVRSGARVKQGQVVAYVGSTGLATGPHLHYEFYVNGAVRNPVTVKLPKAQAVPKSELPRFLEVTAPLLSQLNPETPKTQLATSEPSQTTL